jgi:DNA polymerase-3 subunit delta'
MSSFSEFFGNEPAAHTLRQMIASGRIAQTILLSGPEGVGKATLARRFAAELLGDGHKIEQDDLSLPQNVEAVEQREKWPADKRSEDPLLFASHPDFITFAPDGPLRQITIQQMRILRERAQFKPLRGHHRVFLIDHLERANEQSANSLLKILEEPPEYLILVATAENPYDVLPTIRSRSVALALSRLPDEVIRAFVRSKNLSDPESRVALSEGCPGIAARLDLELFRERRNLILAAFETGAHLSPWSSWIQYSESFSSRKSEKLDFYLKLAYGVLEDVLRAWQGRAPTCNRDATERIQKISRCVSYSWIECAARALDELVLMVRRNIQKTAALDAMIIKLRNRTGELST